MGAGWVAGVTRARAMAAGRAGPDTVRRVAAAPSLTEALRALARTPYRRGLDVHADAAAAGHAVSGALIWQLRVLAGWQPRPGSTAVRALAADFEIDNTRAHLLALTGAPQPPPHPLGALSTAWPRLARAGTAAEVRAVLATSRWGDPGTQSPAAMITAMRLSASARTAVVCPPAARWAAGDAALLAARQIFLSGRPPTGPAARHAAVLLGPHTVRATDFDTFRARLPAAARWVLDGIERPDDLWRAEARRWSCVERDGQRLLGAARQDLATVVGAVAVLRADAWRVRAALAGAAHGGRAREAFDELLG
ncbi:hypothetical protein ACL02U_24830 [Streptomyces sp. MS06]|uniref:hypothetical protein n=1 Tax=Streptomyces sp. MS06 TaxID=3385974 RepID=UPI0039A1666E